MIYSFHGGGVSGNELSSVEWHIPREKKPGFWNGVWHWLFPTIAVAGINSTGEWCSDGWNHVLPMLRAEVRRLS